MDSCFALFGALQYGVTTRESSDKNISAHFDFKPRHRTLDTHRITPYHVSSGGQGPSFKLMSRRENKELAIDLTLGLLPPRRERSNVYNYQDLRPRFLQLITSPLASHREVPSPPPSGVIEQCFCCKPLER